MIFNILLFILLVMKKSILMLLLATAMLSCKKDKEKTTSPYEGTYSGNYTGGDKGSLVVAVDAGGKITGTSISSNTLELFQITGSVDNNGTFNGTTDINTTFKGSFSGSNASGTYANTSLKISGNWSVTKK